jgi:hypothetical protein
MKATLFFEFTEVGIQLPFRGYVKSFLIVVAKHIFSLCFGAAKYPPNSNHSTQNMSSVETHPSVQWFTVAGMLPF